MKPQYTITHIRLTNGKQTLWQPFNPPLRVTDLEAERMRQERLNEGFEVDFRYREETR